MEADNSWESGSWASESRMDAGVRSTLASQVYFQMDQVAEAAGSARRTLITYNYGPPLHHSIDDDVELLRNPGSPDSTHAHTYLLPSFGTDSAA